jgi:hypothetical protein
MDQAIATKGDDYKRLGLIAIFLMS